MEIDAQTLIEAMREQRNAALDELAMTKAALATLQKESNDEGSSPEIGSQ